MCIRDSYDFDIVEDVKKNKDLLSYGGHSAICFVNCKGLDESEKELLTQSAARIYFIGNKDDRDLVNFSSKNRIKLLNIPFTNLELKNTFATKRA